MTDSDQPQTFCTQCGAQVRSGNAFCSSCGKNLTPPPVNRNTPRPILEEEDLRRIAISVGIVVVLLLLFGLFSYSLALGTFIVAAGVTALLAWRRTRGLQSRPEEQLYKLSQKHWANVREAYREGKHREAAAKAQGFGRNLYEGSRARYEAWNESRTDSAGGDEPLASDEFKLGKQAAMAGAVIVALIVVAFIVVGGLVDGDSGGASYADDINAESLLGMINAGTVGTGIVVEDVEVSGDKATVLVSESSRSEAESLCYWALEAAEEFYALGGMESSGSHDGQITEVVVKRPGGFWNMASC